MEGNAYLDFDLRFTKGEEGYRAEALKSPGGDGGHAFRLPFQEHELENYLLKIGQRRVGMRKADSPENRAARDFGAKLFDTVFREDLQTAFKKSLETARSGGHGLRIRLHLGETPELADLPWEYLYQSQRREFFALSTETPIVRYFDLQETVKPLAVTPPLRVLVMLSNPSDVDCLDVEKEWQKLKEAVRHLEERKLLIVERLQKATLGELQSRLRKGEYHIFHFVGHGSFDDVTQESVLAMEDENGRKRLVSGPDLGIYLRDEPALRLVLLNACEGGRASRSDPFSGAAQSLVLKGIPAVIAMQFEVSDDAAIALASGFYGALADDYPVDAALAEARKAVFATGSTVEWGTPVLYLRTPDGRIFDVAKTAAPVIDEPAKEITKTFVTPPPIPPLVPENVVPGPREKVDVLRETKNRGPRRLIASLLGIFLVIAFVGLGLWAKSTQNRKKASESANVSPSDSAEASPEPVAEEPPLAVSKNEVEPEPANKFSKGNAPANIATLPLVKGGGTPANPDEINALKQDMAALDKYQKESSSKLDQMDEDARRAISRIRTDATPPANSSSDSTDTSPPPAGTSFNPTGWWTMTVYEPYSVTKINFETNGRFQGTITRTTGTGPTRGGWTYFAGTSMLVFTYDDDGSYLRFPLVKHGDGFLGAFDQNGTRVEIYLQEDDTGSKAAD